MSGSVILNARFKLWMHIPMYRVSSPMLLRAATVLALGLFASACGERAATGSRPQLLSVEAARFENVKALEELGLVQRVQPTPARLIEFEACVPGSNACLELQQNTDRID